MIEDTVFAREWAILEDRFQTRHNGETAARYLDALFAELDDQQFALACARCFQYDRFFPSPQDLIDHAFGDTMAQADEAWDAIMERYSVSAEVCTDEGTLSRKVLAKLGGTRKLYAIESEWSLRDMRDQFIRRYARELRDEAARRAGLALPAPTIELKAHQSTPEPEDAFLPLDGPRGKTVDFLQMARKAGVNVPLPTDLPPDMAAD